MGAMCRGLPAQPCSECFLSYAAPSATACCTHGRAPLPASLPCSLPSSPCLPACPSPPAAPAPQVQYQDKPAFYTAEQLMAMLLVDLKEIAAGEGSPVSECVLAVPAFFTEPERHAMLAAAQVRGVAGRLGCWQCGASWEWVASSMPGGRRL